MKATIVTILICATVASGQQRSSRVDVALPAPGGAGTVTLSLAEYNRLSELAAQKPKATEAPPLPFALSRAAFNFRVEDHSLTGNVDIDGSVLDKGAVKVPLTTGLIVLEAKRSTNPLPLFREGQTHFAVLEGPAPFSVSLNIASTLTVEAGRASFFVQVPAASSSLLTLELPGSHANVKIEPGLITSRSTNNGNTIIEATLEPGKPARVWWTTREIAAPVAQREVRFLSDVKQVVSVGDSQLRVAALCDLTVIQGEAADFRMPLPSGFELTEVTGSSLDSFEVQNGVLILNVLEPAKRNHQFLIGLERSNREKKVDSPLLAFTGAQHETGELLVEGVGAMELTPTESGGLRRIDVREARPIARSLARFPLQAAFRYNRRPGDTPKLQLEWTQFPDSQVLSAVAERATVTTLTNFQGKSLTEVTLRVRNHSQPFVKVNLPPGATLVSAEVEGERVKPVSGDDGSRVPLLRVGFNPTGAYTVSFVYLSTGTQFAKSGVYEMVLPKLDIPVNVLTWEVSLPERLEVKQFGGNAFAAELFPAPVQSSAAGDKDDYGMRENNFAIDGVDLDGMEAGQVGGIVADPNGGVVPGANVTVVNTQTGARSSTTSDAEGRWAVSGLQSGPVRVTIEAQGFKSAQQELQLSPSQPARMGTTMEVGAIAESVTVTSSVSTELTSRQIADLPQRKPQSQSLLQIAPLNAPSQNVLNLQRRVAGILPVRVDVPRGGRSYRFVRPLVLGEETKLTFQYRAR